MTSHLTLLAALVICVLMCIANASVWKTAQSSSSWTTGQGKVKSSSIFVRDRVLTLRSGAGWATSPPLSFSLIYLLILYHINQ